MNATASRLTIEIVPAAFASLMGQAGRLPEPPASVRGIREGARPATFEEDRALIWLACWNGPKITTTGIADVNGIAAYRDVYDHHTGLDAREVIYIAGKPRAVVALLLRIRDDSRACGRLMFGSFEARNESFKKALTKLGGTLARVGYEA